LQDEAVPLDVLHDVDRFGVACGGDVGDGAQQRGRGGADASAVRQRPCPLAFLGADGGKFSEAVLFGDGAAEQVTALVCGLRAG
jgi:hypothetical protein